MNKVIVCGVEADEDTIKKIKKHKKYFVDYMISHGLFYNPLQIMSAMANEAIANFNNCEHKEFEIHESFKVGSREAEEIPKHINLFRKNMREDGIEEKIYMYVDKVLRDTIEILTDRHNKFLESQKQE